MGYTDSLSQAIIFIHQTIFKIYGKITGPWNRGQSEAQTHGRMDKRTERRKLYTPGHTSYAGGIITEPRNVGHSDPLLVWSQAWSHIDILAKRYHIYTSNSLQNISQNHWTMKYKSQWPTFILRSSIKSYWLITLKYYVYISNSLQGMRQNHSTMKYSSQSPTFILRWSIKSYWLIIPRYYVYISNSLQDIRQNHWTMKYRSQWPTFILRSSFKSYWLFSQMHHVYTSNSLQGMRQNHWTMEYRSQWPTFILKVGSFSFAYI